MVRAAGQTTDRWRESKIQFASESAADLFTVNGFEKSRSEQVAASVTGVGWRTAGGLRGCLQHVKKNQNKDALVRRFREFTMHAHGLKKRKVLCACRLD